MTFFPYFLFFLQKQFFNDHEAPAADRVIQQSLESIRLNVKWLERDAAAIEEWLKSKGY